MNSQQRHLVTTADESTWGSHQPIVFLGEWCILQKRKHIWSKLDYVIGKPYGIERRQKDCDFLNVRQIESNVFSELCKILNDQHSLKRDERCWKILIGHWFTRFVKTIVNRSGSISQVLRDYKISSVTLYEPDQVSLSAFDTDEANWKADEPLWNTVLCGEIIELIATYPINFQYIPLDINQKKNGLEGFKNINLPLKNVLAKIVFDCIFGALRPFARNSDAFILNPYLSKCDHFLTELSLGQVPQYWRRVENHRFGHADPNLRSQLTDKLILSKCVQDEIIVKKLLFKCLPLCFLEGFSIVQSRVDSINWPKSPKFIWTSNNFDTDELFKFWTAAKIEMGVKYYVGQHGNNYGTSRYMFPSIEEITSDKFFTWGWTDGLKQHIPTFAFKIRSKNKFKIKINGGLLIVADRVEHRNTTWDGTFQFRRSVENQIQFVKNLNTNPRKSLTLRLHGSSKLLNGEELLRWQEFDSSIKIDQGKMPILKLVARSRLVVYVYDSTGILELLASNIPVVAFWMHGLDNIRDSACEHYKKLVDAKIVHLTYQSAAQHVNQRWDNIGEWWASDRVQNARLQFCKRYANIDKKAIGDIKNFLLNNS